MTIKILLCSDQPIVTYGLEVLINSQYPMMKVDETFTKFASLLAYLDKHSTDLIIIDLGFDTDYTIEIIVEINKLIHTKILCIANSNNVAMNDQAILSGAKGLIKKTDILEIILKAIMKVYEGQIWLDQNSIHRLMILHTKKISGNMKNHEQSKMESLTVREQEVLKVITTDTRLTIKAIALQLHISESTLRNHLGSVYKKLGVAGRLELWEFINKSGLKES